MSTDTPAQQFHNPWRESLENCISGDNYLRASEYHELIAELDELYRLLAASPQPTAAQPLKDEQAVAELVEALRALLDEQDAQQGYATPAAYGRARAALSRAPGAGMLNAKLNGAP